MSFIKKIQYNSPVIITYAIISLCALFLNILTNGITNNLLFSVYQGSLTNPLFYVRLFGHVIGHANFNHFFNNFILILLLGPILEEKYGSKKILILILVTAFVTGILFLILSPPDKALLGASGIVFMFIILSSFVNLQKGRIPLTFILVLIVFLGQEIVTGFLNTTDNVSQITHIIGGICGAVLGYVINRKTDEV